MSAHHRALALVLLVSLLTTACGAAEPTATSAPPTATQTPVPPTAAVVAPTSPPVPTDTLAPPEPSVTPEILLDGRGTELIAFASNQDGDWDIYTVNVDGSSLQQLTDNDADDLSPSWSQDGAQVAFVSNRDGNDEIYIMNLDGSNQRRLTDTDASESFPAWSPDGTEISFDSDRDGNWEIYVMASDGGDPRRLTDNSAADWITSWSPDGSQIVFESKRDGNYEIYVMHADGSDQRRLTDDRAHDGFPAWSPDGAQIAFMSQRDGNYEIYVMNADGTNQRRLTDDLAQDSDPAWSPDGDWLAFVSQRDGNDEIYIVRTDGSLEQRLTTNTSLEWGPAWQPALPSVPSVALPTATLDLIAFVSTRDGNGEIYSMNADGGNIRRLTNWRLWDGYPTWSPDGKQIAYYSYLGDKDWVIKVMDADGSNPRQLTDNGICDGAPYWSPDGTRIAFSSDADCTGKHREIYVMNADGSDQTNLTQNDADDMGASWSPDSQEMVFSSDRNGDYELYILNVGGADVRQLTENDARDMMAAWSPGGDQIAFVSDRDGNDEIYVMDVHGNDVQRLTDNAVADWFPFWSPDGSQIVFNSRRDGNLEVYVMDADGGNVQRLTVSPGDDFNAVWQALPPSSSEPLTWIRTYEGDPISAAFDVVPAGDGGYLLVGSTNHTHRDAANEDVHLMKIDAAGQMLWEKTYGGDRFDRGKAILPSAGRGFIILAETESSGAGDRDIYLLQVDEDGNELWSHTFGGPGKERANAILQTADGGYILAGQTASFGAGGADLYLVMTDDQGGEVWSRTYGGEHEEEGYDVQQTPDGGFLVLGQVLQGQAVYVDQKPDILLLKTDSSGEELWSQVWVTEDVDGGHVLLPTSDGTYLIAGITAPAGNQTMIDILLIKMNAEGNQVWNKPLGDQNAVDYAADAIELPGGGYLLTGLFNQNGRGAIPLIRTGADGELVRTRTLVEGRGNKVGMRLLPTPDGGYLIVGTTDQFGRGFETLLIKTDSEGNVKE